MKRLFTLLTVLFVLFLVGCDTAKQNQHEETADFTLFSLAWGTDWETAQNSEFLQNASFDVTENGPRQLVKIEGLDYLGVPLEMTGLAFDIGENAETNGLHSVFLQFNEENEATLLGKLTALYGEPKTAYTDTNGVTIPIQPIGWVSDDTIEDVLTAEEKEYYVNLFPADYEQTRLDAALRSPLSSIRFDAENNLVEFNGNAAAVVSFIKAELQK
ncbi:MAG: hypothetical protein E7402_04590 [Ruminococcaceae bacterium]|nr:hypothetical protein [Oscillospiraceae bacterium]